MSVAGFALRGSPYRASKVRNERAIISFRVTYRHDGRLTQAVGLPVIQMSGH
jgi:hypothetical protein